MTPEPSLLNRVSQALLHILLPETCAHCREDLAWNAEDPLCSPCLSKLRWLEPPHCERCGTPLGGGGRFCFSCRGKTFFCERIRSALRYEPVLQSCLYRFKYEGKAKLAGPLGEWMAERFPHFPELRSATLLVPVPLHPHRLRERGFNQAELLAQVLSKKLGIPTRTILRRIRPTHPQWNLDRKKRLTNVSDAFEPAQPEKLQGESVLLIDDVATTGSTLEACAGALRRAKAGKVWAWTLARQGL